MNIDAYFDKLEQERNGNSFAFLAERVERTAENPYSIAVAKPIKPEETLVLVLAGSGGKGKHLRGYNGYLKQVDEFIKSQPEFKDKNVRVCVAVCSEGKYHGTKTARDLKYFQSWGDDEYVNNALSNMSAEVKEENLHPAYIQDIFNLAIKPKLDAAGNNPKAIKHYMRKINTVSHCHGGYVALSLEEMIQQRMTEQNISAKEQKKVFDNMLYLNYAPDCPIKDVQSQFISVESSQDDHNQWQSHLKEYCQMEKPDFGLVRMPREAGNLFMCAKIDKRGVEGNPPPTIILKEVNEDGIFALLPKQDNATEEPTEEKFADEHSFLGFKPKSNMSKGAIKMQTFANNILKNAVANSLKQSKENFVPLPNVRHLAAETKEQFFEFTKAYFKAHQLFIKYRMANKQELNSFIYWHQNNRINLED